VNDCGGPAGHGTSVAAVVGGTTYGVAKQTTLHAVRVVNCRGVGLVSTVIRGVDWVTANHIKPAVANVSVLPVSASQALDDAATVRTGTSMAAAHVAGVVAQYLQLNPAATPADVALAIKAAATVGVVPNAGPGSPNAVLFFDSSRQRPSPIDIAYATDGNGNW